MHIRPATLDDIEPVASAMRIRDVQEVFAATGQRPHDALFDALVDPTFAYAIADETGTFCLFGVSHYFDQIGSPWLLATDRLMKHKRILLTHAPRYISEMQQHHPILLNYVDARHSDSIRWLRHMGFKLTGYEIHYGYERRPFFQFSMVSSQCARQ